MVWQMSLVNIKVRLLEGQMLIGWVGHGLGLICACGCNHPHALLIQQRGKPHYLLCVRKLITV